MQFTCYMLCLHWNTELFCAVGTNNAKLATMLHQPSKRCQQFVLCAHCTRFNAPQQGHADTVSISRRQTDHESCCWITHVPSYCLNGLLLKSYSRLDCVEKAEPLWMIETVFYRQGALSVTQATVSKHWKEVRNHPTLE